MRRALLIIFSFISIGGQTNVAQASSCLRELSMAAKYLKHDQKERVPYLSKEEQSEIRIQFVNGLFKDKTGAPVNFSGTKMMVVTPDGNMLADLPHQRFPFHHSSLSAGKPVSLAGWVGINNGKIWMITNTSGHYKPSLEDLETVLKYWQSQGADLSETQVGFRVAISSSIASTFYYSLPFQEFSNLMRQNPANSQKLLDLILKSSLDNTKKAKAVAHLILSNKKVGPPSVQLFVNEVKKGNLEVIYELFDLQASDYFEDLLKLLEGVEHPDLERLRIQYRELQLEKY